MRVTKQIESGWDIGSVPNGGYAMMHIVRAMIEVTGRPDPLSITGHFMKPSAPGPLDVDVEVVREGRSTATVLATASQQRDGERIEVLRTMGAFGDLDLMDGPEHIEVEAPEIPPPDECVRRVPDGSGATFPPAFSQRLEQRIVPGLDGVFEGIPVGRAELAGWIRVDPEAAPDVPLDAATVVLFADGYPPALFNAGIGPGWTPTVELTVHLRSRPTTDWFQVRFRSRHVFGGMLEEDGEIWDSNGRLVALSRQLALAPRTG